MKVLGVILAGGKSSRMGRDKAVLQTDRGVFIDTIYNELSLSADIDKIVVSSTLNKNNNYEHIDDKIEDIGPMGGIYSVYLNQECDYYVFLSCDIPNINCDVINDITELALKESSSVVSSSKGRIHPLIACYKRSDLDGLESRIIDKNYALMKWLKNIKEHLKSLNRNLVQYSE